MWWQEPAKQDLKVEDELQTRNEIFPEITTLFAEGQASLQTEKEERRSQTILTFTKEQNSEKAIKQFCHPSTVDWSEPTSGHRHPQQVRNTLGQIKLIGVLGLSAWFPVINGYL